MSGVPEAAQPYGPMERLLHRVALSSDALAELSFELGELFGGAGPGHGHDAGRPVFVSGLARSGTTLLMRLIHAAGGFASLTYRDMPFVLAPRLWNRLSRSSRLAGRERERAHGDGLTVGFDSPEALEEVFWRVHCGGQYIRADRLLPMRAGEDVVRRFRRYVAQILAVYKQPRYLSKNNNNILRLGTLRTAFPDAVILIPFRDPLAHADSLHRQHLRFCTQQTQDAFIRAYMAWLVHFEFGLDHRPFALGPAPATPALPQQLDYWLAQWLRVYRALDRFASDHADSILFFDYDAFCREPQRRWSDLAGRLDLKAPIPGEITVRARSRKAPQARDQTLLREAGLLHARLVARAQAGLAGATGGAAQIRT